MDFTGITVLVTGAASGIGAALVRALDARGAHVVLADRNRAGADETAQSLRNPPLVIEADLSQSGAAAGLIATAHDWRGRLDLVCSNAGMGRNKKLRNEKLDETATQLFEVNFHVGLRLAQTYFARMEETGQRGRIMFTASENALSVPAAVKGSGLGLYAASKHALLIAAEWLRDEYAGKHDIHVLLPGAVYTPLIARALPDPAMAPPGLGLIMPDRCAELALKGRELGLFYIPTHAHIAADMQPRHDGMRDALKALGLG